MNNKDYIHNDIKVTPKELSNIPHVISEADFYTSRPNPNRISRIACEIDEYLKYKRKCTGGLD